MSSAAPLQRVPVARSSSAQIHRSVNTAKLFWSGRSQAVRPRKVCNLDGEPVRIIRRQEAAGILEPVAAASVRVAVARMEQGNLSGIKRFRGTGEYRIHWGPGLRVYLAKDGLELSVLLGGGSKPPAARHRSGGAVEDYKRRKTTMRKALDDGTDP